MSRVAQDDLVADRVDFFAAELGQAEGAGLLADAGNHGGHRRRQVLAALLTVRPPHPVPAPVMAALDDLLAAEAAARPVTPAQDLPRLCDTDAVHGVLGGASLWQGDITTLQVDAIVNAANTQMLGCFAPGHRCIDNAIHAAAGPQLRAECHRLMTRKRQLEPTGQAKVTDGYHLPARHVIHTVGPIVPDRAPTPEHADLLASSYRSCLDAAHAAGDRSIAFCAISTGVFGYPIDAATRVALATVERWLTDHPDAGLHVVFNTFSDRDTAVYRHALSEYATS